jgi:hypothetical protein
VCAMLLHLGDTCGSGDVVVAHPGPLEV